MTYYLVSKFNFYLVILAFLKKSNIMDTIINTKFCIRMYSYVSTTSDIQNSMKRMKMKDQNQKEGSSLEIYHIIILILFVIMHNKFGYRIAMFEDEQRNKIRSLESGLEKSELYLHYMILQLKVEHIKQEGLAAEKKELRPN